MPSLKDIRNRIASVSSTMQITQAMKMVSASKLKRAQDAITAMRPYSTKLTEMIQGLTAGMDEQSDSDYSARRKENRVLIVAITSNRGLCGAFNSNVIKQVVNLRQELYVASEVQLLTIGKKGRDVLRKRVDIFADYSDILDQIDFAQVEQIAQKLIDAFLEGEFDSIQLVYNRFKNAATQIVESEQFLPLIPPSEDQAHALAVDYIYEPQQEEMLKELIPKALKIQLFKAIRDSIASEHGARMTAMHKATDNAKEMKDQLKLTYNKARQAAITGEILEIVGGADALQD